MFFGWGNLVVGTGIGGAFGRRVMKREFRETLGEELGERKRGEVHGKWRK